jgi:signal peptidase I
VPRPRVFWPSVLSWFLPGLVQGRLGRRGAMLGFAVGHLVAVPGMLLSVWFMAGFLLTSFGSMVDGWRRGWRWVPPETNLPVAVEGNRAVLGPRQLTAIAVALGIASLIATGALLQSFKIPSSSMYPTLEIGDHILVDKLTPRIGTIGRGDLIVFDQPCQPERAYTSRVIAVGGDTVEVRCSVVHINGKPLASELVDAMCTYQDYDDYADTARGLESHWFTRECSRYRETLDGHSFDVFYDRERPERDRARGAEQAAQPDPRDFPIHAAPPSCISNGDPASAPNAAQATGKIVDTRDGAGACELQRHFEVPPGSLFVMGDNRYNSNDSRFWGVVPVGLVIGRIIGAYWPLGRAGAIR